jgi:hypothetical protein
MAITEEQIPSGFVGVNQRLIVNLSSTNVSEPKFRYKIVLTDITGGGSTVISTNYIDPDPNDYGIYDCSPRLRSLVKAQITNSEALPDLAPITDMPSDKKYVQVDGAHKVIRCTYEESYAATAADEPTDQGGGGSFDFTIYNGSSLITNGINYNSGNGVMLSTASECLLDVTSNTGFFPFVNVSDNDRFCLAWFNDGENSVEVVKWRYLVFFEDNTSSVHDLPVTGATVGSSDKTMTYFMCGPLDLHEYDDIPTADKPSSGNDWDYYILQPFDSTTAIGGGYQFNRNKRPCRYDHYQLMFANNHGAWSFQTFYMVSKKTLKATGGKTYRAHLGGTDLGEYYLGASAREFYEVNKESRIELVINTDWLTEEEANDMEGYIYSPDVYLLLNGGPTPEPVIVKERSHRYNKYDKKRQYQLTVEVAQSYHRL